MPKGLAVVRWDDRIGTVVDASYPKEIKEITPDITMKIYGTHTLGKDIPSPDFLVAKIESLNIASFYGGLSVQHFVVLLLEPDEKSELYEDPLMEISFRIFENLEGKKYKGDLEELFEYLQRYAMMSDEQKLALFLSDPNRYAIIDRLVVDGSVTKTELEEYVKKKTGRAMEIDVSLAQLVKFGLVQTEWVEGLASECAFLTRDVFPMRIPSRNTIEMARKGAMQKEISEKYLSGVEKFFRDYAAKVTNSLEWINQDAPLVLWAIKDLTVSDVVAALRNGPVEVDKLSKLVKAPDKEVSKALSQLVNAEFVIKIKDKRGNKYALLRSEPRINSTFPDYIINTVIQNYNNGLVPPAQVTRYLNILKDNYPKGT
jgi:DNA-binding transcriptional ArsR family regulator